MRRSLADGSHSPPPEPRDFLLEGLATLQGIALNHQQALVELSRLFGPWDEALSVSQLTAGRPSHAIAEVAESDHIRSIGVVNLSPVIVQVGYGGNSASAGNGIPVLPLGYLVLPLSVNALDLGAATADLEGLNRPARVLVIRFRRNQPLAAGSLTTEPYSPTANQLTANTNPAFTVTNVSQQLLPANSERTGVAIENNSGEPLTFLPGVGPAVAGHGIVLQPSGTWDGRIGEKLWTGPIQVIAPAAGPFLAAVFEV